MRRNCWLRLLPFPHLSSEKELGFALLIWHPWSLPSKVAFLAFHLYLPRNLFSLSTRQFFASLDTKKHCRFQFTKQCSSTPYHDRPGHRPCPFSIFHPGAIRSCSTEQWYQSSLTPFHNIWQSGECTRFLGAVHRLQTQREGFLLW